jgi:hypothetical protein
MTGFQDRIVEFKRVPADELQPHPQNWRTHPKEQASALQAVLSQVGIAGAVVARRCEDGSLQLIDGHLRRETLAGALVPTLIVDLTEHEAQQMLATMDPLAAMAGKDSERLAELFADLAKQGDELARTVWPDYVMDPLLAVDWQPPKSQGDSVAREEAAPKALALTEAAREVLDEAVAMYREDNGAEVSEEEALVGICRAYLAQ